MKMTKKNVLTALVVLAIVVVMILAANYLVKPFNVVEFLKQMHGG